MSSAGYLILSLLLLGTHGIDFLCLGLLRIAVGGSSSVIAQQLQAERFFFDLTDMDAAERLVRSSAPGAFMLEVCVVQVRPARRQNSLSSEFTHWAEVEVARVISGRFEEAGRIFFEFGSMISHTITPTNRDISMLRRFIVVGRAISGGRTALQGYTVHIQDYDNWLRDEFTQAPIDPSDTPWTSVASCLQ